MPEQFHFFLSVDSNWGRRLHCCINLDGHRLNKIQVYGKSTCRTTQKVLEWFNEHNLEIEQIDIISSPPSLEILKEHVKSDNIKGFLNSRSKVYREKGFGKELPSKSVLLKTMLVDPNLIKRPVVVSVKGVSFGFDENYLSNLK